VEQWWGFGFGLSCYAATVRVHKLMDESKIHLMK